MELLNPISASDLSKSANLKKMVSNTLARDRDEDAKAYFTVK